MKSALSRILITIIAAAAAASASGMPAADNLYLQVTIVTGEHSRDSNSTTASLEVNRDTLVYEQSRHGAHSGGSAPIKKEYRLSPKDRGELLTLLKEKNLLVTRTVTSTVTPLSEKTNLIHYFELKIHSKLSGKEHLISIDGPRSAEKLKKEAIYQHSVYLLEQLYRIINRTDPDIILPQLID